MSDVFASVDLGGTNIKCCMGTAEGKVLGDKSVPTDSHLGAQSVLDRMGALVGDLAREVGRKPLAVGIGCPGLIDLKALRVEIQNTFQAWTRVRSLRSRLSFALPLA